MNKELLQPFVQATMNVISTMAMTESKPGEPLPQEDNKAFGVVTGMIGVTGERLVGSMMLGFEENCIVSIVNNLLGEEYTELNEDVVDAVGEITNMVLGGAKPALDEQGYSMQMSTPTVIQGTDLELKVLGKETTLFVPFETDAGHFRLTVCLDLL